MRKKTEKGIFIYVKKSLIRIKLVSFTLQLWPFRGAPAASGRSQSRRVILVGAVHTGCLDRGSACLGAQQLCETAQRTKAGQRVEGPRLGQELGEGYGTGQGRGGSGWLAGPASTGGVLGLKVSFLQLNTGENTQKPGL